MDKDASGDCVANGCCENLLECSEGVCALPEPKCTSEDRCGEGYICTSSGCVEDDAVSLLVSSDFPVEILGVATYRGVDYTIKTDGFRITEIETVVEEYGATVRTIYEDGKPYGAVYTTETETFFFKYEYDEEGHLVRAVESTDAIVGRRLQRQPPAHELAARRLAPDCIDACNIVGATNTTAGLEVCSSDFETCLASAIVSNAIQSELSACVAASATCRSDLVDAILANEKACKAACNCPPTPAPTDGECKNPSDPETVRPATVRVGMEFER